MAQCPTQRWPVPPGPREDKGFEGTGSKPPFAVLVLRVLLGVDGPSIGQSGFSELSCHNDIWWRLGRVERSDGRVASAKSLALWVESRVHRNWLWQCWVSANVSH